MTATFTIQNSKAQIAGVQAGAGNTLVFLHAGVADKRMWQPQIIDLQDSYHVVAYDRRGFRETTAVDEPFSHVEDLRVVLEQLGLETAVALISCSQGGRVALDFALAYPQRVAALVLIAPAISGAPAPTAVSPDIEAIFDKLDAAEEADDLAQINAIEAHLWLDGPTSVVGRVSGALRELFLDMNGIALKIPELTQEIEPESAYTKLSAVHKPALVIWGALDFPHLKARSQYLVDNIPVADGKEIPGTAHLPNLEQPAIINSLLRAFLI